MPPDDVWFIRSFFEELGGAGPDARALYATMITRLRRLAFATVAAEPSPEAQAAAAQLTSAGIVDLGSLIEPTRLAEMRAHLDAAPLFAAHVAEESDGVAHDFAAISRSSAYGSYARDDLYRCPHLIELANDPRLLGIAEAYLGCPPTIYSFNAWWSFPQQGARAPDAQHLHRDLDDLRFATLFAYLTPVGPETGPHRYIRHSHDKTRLREALVARGLPATDIDAVLVPLFQGTTLEYADVADALLGDLATVWTGAAGSAVLADTYGLHMGIPPRDGPRLMLWVRYGLGPNRHSFGGGDGRYADMLRARLPDGDRARYINRLLLTD